MLEVCLGSCLSPLLPESTLLCLCQHLEGEVHEACLRELPYSLRDSISLYEIMKVAFNALTEVGVVLISYLPPLWED